MLVLPACAARPRTPVKAPGSSVTIEVPPLPALRAELDQIFNAPPFARATWAVLIQSLASGETLYAINPNKLVMPASNMKIVTLAVAAERLGWDYRFETELTALGDIREGVLEGDLLVTGQGDPTINGRGGSPTRVFEEWAAELRALGIQEISGRIIGDDDAFDEEGLGSGWSWDYLGYGYAAPVGALEFNENIVEVTMRPGMTPGDPVAIDMKPPEAGLVIVNRVTTGGAGSSPDVELKRLPGRDELEVYGTVPAKLAAYTRTASVDNPTRYFARTLRTVLIAQGIAVRGEAVDIDDLVTPPDRTKSRRLFVHQSPPLEEIGRVLMKVSQNLYAETLLKTLGRTASPVMTTASRPGSGVTAAGDGPQPAAVVRGTTEGGRRVVRETLSAWGIPPESLVIYDGSGLARGNLVTADLIVRLLRQMHVTPKHTAFAETLPVGGVDGSLDERFKDSRARGNVRAKTGSIANVRALSGYLRTQDDELLVFSMMANNFNMPQSSIDATTDRVVDRLVQFSRR